jgi:hypothetical protein
MRRLTGGDRLDRDNNEDFADCESSWTAIQFGTRTVAAPSRPVQGHQTVSVVATPLGQLTMTFHVEPVG